MKNSYHFLSDFYRPDRMTLIITLKSWYYPYFTDDKCEAQKGK